MLPMLPMQRVSGSGSGRALSAALLSRECIICAVRSAAATRSSASSPLVRSFSPPLTPATYGTCYRMDAGAGAGAEPRCLA